MLNNLAPKGQKKGFKNLKGPKLSLNFINFPPKNRQETKSVTIDLIMGKNAFQAHPLA